MKATQTKEPTGDGQVITLEVAGRTITMIELRWEFHAARRDLQALLPEDVTEAGGPASPLVPLRRVIASIERARDELDCPGALTWQSPLHHQRWYVLHAAKRLLEEVCVAASSMTLAADYLTKCTNPELGAQSIAPRSGAGSVVEDVQALGYCSEQRFVLEVGLSPSEWLAARAGGLNPKPPAGVSIGDVTAVAQAINKIKAMVGQELDQAGTTGLGAGAAAEWFKAQAGQSPTKGGQHVE